MRLLSFAGVYPEPYGAGFTLERSEGLRTGSVWILAMTQGGVILMLLLYL